MRKWLLCFLLIVALLCGCRQQTTCQTHKDANEDALCDLCGETLLIYLDFYAINDLHGKFADTDANIGVDELTTYLRSMQASDDIAVLLSVGDMWQGSAESNLTEGLIITDWMNDLGFAAMTLGNHEYDWGEDAIRNHLASAQFPFLAINIYDRDTNQRVDYCQPSVVIDYGDVQVGIIGAMGDCYSSISSDKVQNVYFLTGDALTELVKAESERLRAEEGVDIVVYTLHDGWETSDNSYLSESQMAGYYDISLSDGYVDLVFEGHTHQKYVATDAYGVYHLQHRGDNTGGISHVELSYHRITGEISVVAAELVRSRYENFPDDPIVDQLLDKYLEQISASKEVLGYNSVYRNSKWLRQKVADLYLQAGLEMWGAEYDIILGGGFLSIRSPYELAKGDVTYGVLQSLFPFDNELVLCSIRGVDLLSRFIHTSNENYFISRADQTAIDPNGAYYIVVDSYTASYAPNKLTQIARYGENVYARDLLAAWIAEGGAS